MNNRNEYLLESERLRSGPPSNMKLGGIGSVRIEIKSPGNSRDVLNRARTVMSIVCETALTGQWPTVEVWEARLPRWFTEACAKPRPKAEVEAYLERIRMMSPQERAREEENRAWTLPNWLYWLEPKQRSWYWWDAQEVDADRAVIAIQVDSWPFPWGALKWLLKASGASSVEAEE